MISFSTWKFKLYTAVYSIDSIPLFIAQARRMTQSAYLAEHAMNKASAYLKRAPAEHLKMRWSKVLKPKFQSEKLIIL